MVKVLIGECAVACGVVCESTILSQAGRSSVEKPQKVPYVDSICRVQWDHSKLETLQKRSIFATVFVGIRFYFGGLESSH